MRPELPPYVSMVDVLEADYNAQYDAWKREYMRRNAQFINDNMTDIPPITLGQIGAMWYNKRIRPQENDAIRFLVITLMIILVIFWIIPALAYHGNPAKMDKIGTLEIITDIITGKDLISGVYVTETDGTRRRLTESEIADFKNKRMTTGVYYYTQNKDGTWEEVKRNEIYGYMGENENCG